MGSEKQKYLWPLNNNINTWAIRRYTRIHTRHPQQQQQQQRNESKHCGRINHFGNAIKFYLFNFLICHRFIFFVETPHSNKLVPEAFSWHFFFSLDIFFTGSMCLHAFIYANAHSFYKCDDDWNLPSVHVYLHIYKYSSSDYRLPRNLCTPIHWNEFWVRYKIIAFLSIICFSLCVDMDGQSLRPFSLFLSLSCSLVTFNTCLMSINFICSLAFLFSMTFKRLSLLLHICTD